MKLFIALLFALIVASAHTGEAATRFLFAYGAIGGNAMPLWIAQEQGIFRKYNLEPQLVYIIVLPLRDRAMSQPLSRLHARPHATGGSVYRDTIPEGGGSLRLRLI